MNVLQRLMVNELLLISNNVSKDINFNLYFIRDIVAQFVQES